MSPELKVFAIIVTYRGGQWYDRCFGSLRASTYPVKVVVVDNASCDGSVEYIREKYPDIELICSDKNLGFGQANNRGLRYALDHECDYAFLLNQDAWIEPDTIARLLAIHAKNKDYGIISPIHLIPEKTSIDKGLLSYLDDHRITDSALFEDLFFNRVKDIYPTTFINAAVWLLPRFTLETVGGFDPLFFHYEEDDNYLNRVIYHGFRIGICPHVIAVHDRNNRFSRVVSKEEISRRHQSALLVRFTDATKQESVDRFIVHLLRKTITQTVKGKWGRAKEYGQDMLFLLRQRKSIKHSLAQSLMDGPQWL